MTESAEAARLTDRRRQRTEAEITRCARRLADEHGLDGFTMDELADAVGVSRRTLFNYVPGKIDAVLGEGIPIDDSPLTEFRNGGPSGDLVADLRSVGAEVLRAKGDQVDDVARMRRLLRSDVRLLKAIHERLEEIALKLADMIIEREGSSFDPFKAQVLARTSLFIFDTAIEAFLADPTVSADEHYLRVFDVTTELFNHGGSES